MFLTEAKRTSITEDAATDLAGFLATNGAGEQLADWQEAQDEIIAIHGHFARSPALDQFVHYLFAFLDTNPLLAVKEGPENIKLRRFLQKLHKWLECFASAREEMPEFFGISHIMDFGHYLANSVLHRQLHWTNASNPTSAKRGLVGYPKDDFVSWMIVMDEKNIHIIYDETRIRGEQRPVYLVQQIFERVLLHELGHARRHLDYFGSFMPGNSAQPFHETEAWLYGLMIRALVVATRARIDRYLGQADGSHPL